MPFDANNLVINRPLRGIAYNSAGDILWTVDQIKDPSLTMTTESVDATDALGVPIMTFDRSKSCEFSATQAVFDLGLLAAQNGVSKKVASSSETINVPMWETVVVPANTATVTLKRAPIDGSIPYIWELKADHSLSTRYSLDDAAASETEFTVNDTTLTVPTGATAERTYLIPYEYVANGSTNAGAVSVTSSADAFGKACKFVLKCLGHNICDPNTECAIWVIFDNVKLSSDFDITLSPEMEQKFTLKVMTNYCDVNKAMFSIIMPEG